jgi:hypothetical protein
VANRRAQSNTSEALAPGSQLINSAPAVCTWVTIESVTALLNGSEPVDATSPMRRPMPLSGAMVRNATTVPGGSVAVDRGVVVGVGA